MGYRQAKLSQLIRDIRLLARPSLLKPLPRNAQAREKALKNVHVILHTHWDREWWMTFENFRAILVPLIFDLMDLLEANPDFKSFTFDGQVAPIDDFLDTLTSSKRKLVEKKLSEFIKNGRIQIGPWYTLSDQFLVSGETTLRNLELGIKRAKELGRVMPIAYCPDQFGLIQELPKILNTMGINRVIGERGMSRSLPKRFKWATSDGSTVEMLNLKDGYFHKQLRARNFRNTAKKNHGQPAMFLAGYDHAVPSSDIIQAVQKAGVSFSSLPEFWDAQAENRSEPAVFGEMRSAGDKNILPNVISNRVDQRHIVAKAEYELERYAEPLSSILAGQYPREELDKCWKLQIWNAAHDSACATGIDEVTKAVISRAVAVSSIASAASSRVLEEFSKKIMTAGTYVWNPSNFSRDFYLYKDSKYLTAKSVGPLGWAQLTSSAAPKPSHAITPAFRFIDQTDHGDAYTFSPSGRERSVDLPVKIVQQPGENFSRLNITWNNHKKNHRIRILFKLTDNASVSIADTAFGHVKRPATPELIQGRDRLNGYPASKFIVAGGIAILVDQTVEYELLPKTNELAITILRSHGALSVLNPKYRLWAAGPRLTTNDTQMIKQLNWNFGVLPWPYESKLPWREWEVFALPGRYFNSSGGGKLGTSGALLHNVPDGILSAVTTDKIRTFDADDIHKIRLHKLDRVYK